MNFKEVILSSETLDFKVKKLTELFEHDVFFDEALFSEPFLEIYIPFSILILNTIDPEKNPPFTTKNENRKFILKSLNKLILKNTKNQDLVFVLNKVLETDNLHNVILALKILASLIKSPVMNLETIDRHVSVVVDLINSIFHRLDTNDEGCAEMCFFTLVQVFSYVSDVIQRQQYTEKKVDGIIQRSVSFYRLFLEHRRIIEMVKYNKGTALEMISSLSKLFKLSSDSLIFSTRNEVLSSTIFELFKFSLFYCPTDAVDLRKELFFYIFKILLRNKDMYLPKIEELFDVRLFYLDESYLINIKGLIGLTDLASIFSDNLTRRVPYELQRRTGEILENNIKMAIEKLEGDWAKEEDGGIEDEIKLKYEKSLKFHLEIIYEIVNLIYKQMGIFKKFGYQKIDFIDFSNKQFSMISQLVEFSKNMLIKLNDANENNTELINLVKSTFLALSKPFKELSEGISEILKNNTEIQIEEFFKGSEIFYTFEGVIATIDIIKLSEEESQYLIDIILFFLTSFNGTLFIDIINKLVVQLFRTPAVLEIHLAIIKKCGSLNLQMVVNEIIFQLADMLRHNDTTQGFTRELHNENIQKMNYAQLVEIYEPVFDFIADVYNFDPGLIGKKGTFTLVNLIETLSFSQDVEDHKLLVYLLGTFNIKNDKLGALHVFFYRNLHFLVCEYYKHYISTLDPLYLDIIFSLPININAISSEWGFLFNPITSALKLKDEISVKAISTFIHIVEASKAEIVVGYYKEGMEVLLEEIINLLEDSRFIVPCSQLLGRLKSFHKSLLSPSFFYCDTSFGKENVFIISRGEKKIIIPIDMVVVSAIETIRGVFVCDSMRKIATKDQLVTFKRTFYDIKREPEAIKRAFSVIQTFLYCEFNGDIHGKESLRGKENFNCYLTDYGEKSQLVYDCILSLFVISGTLENKALPFLKDIFEFLSHILLYKNISETSIRENIILLALIESFSEKNNNSQTVLHHFLDSLVKNSGSIEKVVDLNIPQHLISYFVYLSELKHEKMILSRFNGLNSLLLWDKLPPSIFVKEIKRILDSLILFVGTQKTFDMDYLKGIQFVIARNDTLSCLSFFFKWCIDRLTFNTDNKMERRFCKEILKLLFSKYKNLFVAMFTEKLRGFFYALSDLRDMDLFFTKVDLFVFFVKQTNLFTQKETIVLVKTYFYYILSCNFFILNTPQELFFTPLAIRSSDKFKKWEKNLFKQKDLLKQLYFVLPSSNIEFYNVFGSFDVTEEEKYFYYLVNEIVFMHLAFLKDKDLALSPFSFVFSRLPFGLSTPLKILYAANKPLVKELLLEKYEDCFNSTLSVQVVEKMITIFSVIDIVEDKKLLEFILKVFMECQTQVESLLFAEDPENSIFAKTFELSLKYPEQSLLHTRILRIAFPWLFNSSKKYIYSISKPILDYIEQFSFLTFPFLVRECVDEPFYYLLEYTTMNSVLFNNFVNNLSQGFIEECFENIYNQDIKNIPKALFFFRFLKLIDFDVTPSQINAALLIFAELKMKNKDTQEIKKFIKFAINRFSEQDLNFLFKIDPLIKLNDSCNVKLFQTLSSKPLFGCLLKSINKKDVMSFENLVRFYGEQSWMLIEVFVDVKFHSPNMIEYCKSNLSNANIRSFLLYYLCTFEPQPEYFEMLINLSFEERKYTIYSLRKVVEKCVNTNEDNQFEEIILSHLQSEIHYKTNIHILYPLLVYYPRLITQKIGKTLIGIVYRLLNTFIQFHQKIGSMLFDSLYNLFGFTEPIRKLHNLLFTNFIHTKKNNILSFLKNEEINLEEVVIYPETFEINNCLIYLEMEILSSKSLEYKLTFCKFVLGTCKKEIFKYPLKESTVDFLFDNSLIAPKDLPLKDINKITLANSLKKSPSFIQKAFSFIEEPFPFPNLLEYFLLSPPIYFIEYLQSVILQPEKKENLCKLIENTLLDSKTPLCQTVYLLISFPSKNILTEENLLNLALSVFLKNKSKDPVILNNLNELFFKGLTHVNGTISQKYLQFLDEILPNDIVYRIESLLELDWTGCPKNLMPFIMAYLLLQCLDSIEIFIDKESESNELSSLSTQSSLKGEFKNDLLNFLYVSPKACLSTLEGIIKREDQTQHLWISLSACSSQFNDDLVYSLCKALGKPSKGIILKGGNLTFHYLLNNSDSSEKLKMYKEMGNRDYVYGTLRSLCKFPETMQASLFQQFGDFKKAQLVYEKIQQECCEAKVSFYEDEYEILTWGWIDCARELQQWDLCYTFKNDSSLTTDSLFITSNLNNPPEREAFISNVNLMPDGIKKSFYELFYSFYATPTPDSFVNLLSSIAKSIKTGSRNGEFLNYYSTLMQIILEIYDTTGIFSFRPDSEERINSLSYVWEDKEPLLESSSEILVLYSTWRKHFFRRLESFSLTVGDEGESNTKLKKTMYIKGNNGLGRNANFLALAFFNKGYYENALFLLKDVFELPSIKILDAYRKVIYELLCYFELGEYKLGLDLANSTNIVHFTDEQSSNIFRIRGMFSENIQTVEETEKLYFQAIQFFSSSENYFYYVNLLMGNLQIYQDEIVSSTLSGLSLTNSVFSKNLVMQFLILLKTQPISFDLPLFKSLLRAVHLPHFVFFIPQLVDLLPSFNSVYVKLILDELIKVYPQPVLVQLKMKPFKDFPITVNPTNKDLNNLLVLFEDLVMAKCDTIKNELVECLEELVDYLCDTLWEIDLEKVKSLFIKINQLIDGNIEVDFTPISSLSSIITNLTGVVKHIKNNFEVSKELIEKKEKLNKILSEHKFVLFGSFSKVKKDYSNCVTVESIDKFSKDLILIGGYGKFYQVDCNKVTRDHNNPFMYNLPSLYHILSLELSTSYYLRSREAFMPLPTNELFMQNISLDVFDTAFYAFEDICGRENYLTEFVKAYEKEFKVEDFSFSSIDLEKDILNLLKPKVKENKVNQKMPLNDLLKLIEDGLTNLKLPKLNQKTKLKVFKECIDPLCNSLTTNFCDFNAFSTFMLKNTFSKSFALNLSINNFLQVKTKNPKNDTIQKHTGLFIRRNLNKSEPLTSSNTLYISPGIQKWIGIDNIEGPFLSTLYFSSNHLLKSRSLDLIIHFFYAFSPGGNNLNDIKIHHREKLKEIVKVEENDHQIIKIVNGWTDIGNISKNKVSENLWI